MKRALFLALVASCGAKATPPSAPPSNAAAAPPCTTETVAGDWLTETGSDFEDITLSPDGTFMSHLHARPFYVGRWSLEGGTLVLAAEGGTEIRITGVRCADHLAGDTEEDDVDWRRAP